MPTDDTRPSLGRRIWRMLSGTPEPLRYEASAAAGTPPGERRPWTGPDPAVPLLTVADLRARRFASTKFVEGYAHAEVDAFLDRVATALAQDGVPTMAPQEVADVRFTGTKFRAGYDQGDVDDFLDLVVAELRRRHAAR